MKYIKHFETFNEAKSFFNEADRAFPCIAITDADKILIANSELHLTWYNEFSPPPTLQ